MTESPARTTIISIQSQVVHGHVGNSAAVQPMQANGITVASIPTTLLSNHPHYPTVRGQILDAGLVGELIVGIEERGLVERAAVLVTGYLGSTAIGEVVAAFLERARRRNPALVYVCDPVIGDDELGVFVASDLPALIVERLVPQAQIVTPNRFELEVIAGESIRTVEQAVAAARRIDPPQVAVTGCVLTDSPPGTMGTLAIERTSASQVTTPRLPIRPAGTGDLFTAVLAARLARGIGFADAVADAAASTYAVVAATADSDAAELRLDLAVADLVRPGNGFPIVPLD